MISRIFYLVDSKEEGLINFEDYFQFIFFLFKGTLKKKLKFIFKIIAGKDKKDFSFMDLKNFYTLVNNTSSNEHRQMAETELARTVFKLINLSEFSKITFEHFCNFLTKNPNLIDLFDVIELNVEKGKELKMQTHLGRLNIFDNIRWYPK
jgi:Ca2+-binding EF-hand superfamily protein